MTAAMRKKNEELTINLKCTIGVPMTDWGEIQCCHRSRETGLVRQPYFIQ